MRRWLDEDWWIRQFPVGCRVAIDMDALMGYRGRYRRGWGTRLPPPYTGAVLEHEPPYLTRELHLRLHLDGRKHPSSRLIPASCVSGSVR